MTTQPSTVPRLPWARLFRVRRFCSPPSWLCGSPGNNAALFTASGTQPAAGFATGVAAAGGDAGMAETGLTNAGGAGPSSDAGAPPPSTTATGPQTSRTLSRPPAVTATAVGTATSTAVSNGPAASRQVNGTTATACTPSRPSASGTTETPLVSRSKRWTGEARRAQRRPLKPIMFCTADSLSSAI
jgi:hypothetical protein